VVDLHRPGVDRRLERGVVVRQLGEGERHRDSFVSAVERKDMLRAVHDESEVRMSSYEEIRPRELKPALLELDGISRASVEAHYKLYQGYVNKRNEILGKLATADLGTANQVYSELRALKVDLSFAVGGIKNHEVYFEHLGGDGGDPAGAVADLIRRDFGSADAWRADLKATGMAGRGWAWTAYDWDEGRLFNYLGDAQNTFPIWNATPLVALDVYEHAYFLDFQTDRAAYIDAFFDNLDWAVVNDWVSKYQIPLK
jgi:Fe-Mn family superoxide dismutase